MAPTKKKKSATVKSKAKSSAKNGAKNKSKSSAKAKAKAAPAKKVKPVRKAVKAVAPAAPKAAKKAVPVSSSASSFKPLNDRILIAVEAAVDTTPGGIIIPGTVAERPFRGQVLAKGPGRRNKKGALRPLDVNVGDTVVFPQYAGTKIEMGGDEFLILSEEEILAISIA